MNSKSLRTQSIIELENALITTINTDFQPTIAIVFASVKQDLVALGELFTKYNIQLIGSTTAGEFKNKDISEDGIVVLLMDMNKDYFKVAEEEVLDGMTYSAAQQIAYTAQNQFDNPVFITLFTFGLDGDKLVGGLEDTFQKPIKMFGGMAGNDMSLGDTYVFTNNKILANGLLALILDNDKVLVEGLATSGWESIGSTHTITKAKEQIIYTINDKPALDVFLKFFGFYGNFEGEGVAHKKSTLYPLQLIRNGSYVLRAHVEGNEEEGYLRMAAPVKEGEQFKFSITPGFEIVEETIKEFGKYREKLTDIDAAILFSCKARHMALGPFIEEELEGIYDLIQKPMIGFFCYGEVGQSENGNNNYYNQTCSLVTFTERS